MVRLVNNAEEAAAYVEKQITGNKVVAFSKTTCPFCVKVKGLFQELNTTGFFIELDTIEPEDEVLIKEALKQKTNQTSVPNVFINQKHIGGCDATFKLHEAGQLVPLLN